MGYKSFVQSHILKIIASVGSFVFIAALLVNPTMYTVFIQTPPSVNANFVSNEYQPDYLYVVNSDERIALSYGARSSEGVQIQSYTVQRGDTVEQIAQKYALSIDQIKRVNNLIDNDLLIGQRLYLTPLDGFIYEVKEESISLMVFANLYNIDQDLLLKVNNQVNPMLPYERGQAIFVPNMSLEEAYKLSLLIRPKPKPVPEKVVVNTNKSNQSTTVSTTVPKKPVTSSSSTRPTSTVLSYSASTTLNSWRYVFKESNGMAGGHCTYYAAHKATFAFPEISPGVRFRALRGNANKWFSSAQSQGFTTATKPSVGAIAVFQQGGSRYHGAGHVAIVEEVDWENKRMKVSDMNYAGLWTVTIRWIQLNDSMTQTTAGQTLIGFIPEQPLPPALQEQYEALKK